jgi:4-aminobutyrate aminotransferase
VSGLEERDRGSVAAIGKLRFSPLAVAGGEGSTLVAEDGRRLLDLSAGWGAASLGYGHPAIVSAVAEAARTGAGAGHLSFPNASAIALAEELLGTVPGGGERKVWFGHSGSDANEAATKALEASTGRSRFISFIGAYHGGTSGSMSVSAHTPYGHTGTRAGHVLLPYADPYRPMLEGDVAGAVLGYLDRLLETACPPEQVAGLLVEPIQSDGGVIVPAPGFLRGLAERCRRHGIALVCDEVKVGLGRTGMLHAFAAEGIEPDVVVLGKGLGGGLPLSAVIGPAPVMDVAEAFAMQTTIGNPVCAEAGRAVLRTIREERLDQQARRAGDVLLSGLRALASEHECIGDVRGRGLVIGVDLVADRETRAPATGLAAKVVYRAYELGAVLTYVGLRSNVLELTPPLVLTEAEAERGVEILGAAIGDAAAGRVPDAAVGAYAGW